MIRWQCVCAVVLLGLVNLPSPAVAAETVGWLESVTILPGSRVLDAKLDTGADTSSLDARGIQVLQKNGEDWVQFKIGSGFGFGEPMIGRLMMLDARDLHISEVRLRRDPDCPVCASSRLP